MTPKHLPIIFLAWLIHFSLSAQDSRPAIYPFDVTVGEQKATISGQSAIFAKIPKPITNDATVSLATEPEMVITNIFPTNGKGEPTQDASAKAKVIITQKGNTFRLNQTMDQSILEPGDYVMNIVLQTKGTARVFFKIAGDQTVAETIDQSKPETVLQAVFDLSKPGGDLKLLKPLQGRGADGDVKDVCSVGEGPPEAQKEFREYFSTGKITGPARIEGERAQVDFLFGPNGRKKETMNLTRHDGKWYLSSF